ncbi:MAG: plasmid pRiA4b ORF-3 family protein [Bacteroidota bacterium]
MKKLVYQLKITLKGSKPPIWRRILVDPEISLIDLHQILQTTMGWSDSHLHVFADQKHEYAPEELELSDTKDSWTVKLKDILSRENPKILYRYDFGDGWEHEIRLEKITEDESGKQIPRCIKGRRNCPPEDCGGIGGYEWLLEIISDPEHEEHDEMLDWLGGEFDPDYFNAQEVNELLR